MILLNNLYYFYANRDNPIGIYFNLYFIQLRRFSQKQHFLENFKDEEVTKNINLLLNKFIDYPFYDKEVIGHAFTEYEAKMITKWQKSFYLDVYREFDSIDCHSKANEYFDKLQSNPSFSFLLKLDDNQVFDDMLKSVDVAIKLENQEDKNEVNIQNSLKFVLSQTFDLKK